MDPRLERCPHRKTKVLKFDKTKTKFTAAAAAAAAVGSGFGSEMEMARTRLALLAGLLSQANVQSMKLPHFGTFE